MVIMSHGITVAVVILRGQRCCHRAAWCRGHGRHAVCSTITGVVPYGVVVTATRGTATWCMQQTGSTATQWVRVHVVGVVMVVVLLECCCHSHGHGHGKVGSQVHDKVARDWKC